ncbi:MAG: hypothetical protein QGI33_03965, partial [Candidatus Brocadiia bacterium]|nr:hypothetical protein [Candidatus Brocadiia bacterium]
FYMSPEQIRDPRETDLRADIYSLGATLYHMICGDPPFGGTSIYDVMNRHMREPLISPRERAPDVPQALCDIIAKMMAKERDDRYQDYSLLIADLEHSLAGEGIVAQGAADLLQTQEKTKGPGLTETRAEQRYRPSRLPSTFLAPVAGVYALLCALALIAGMLLLFQGLRSSLGAVAAWVFAVSVLTLYAAYTVRLARNEGQALESDQQEARGSLLRGVLERLTGGLGLPMPQLYVTGGSTPLSLGYVFSFGRSVLKVSRGFLDALPEEDEMAETLALREIGRLCYGHSTVSALLDGPLRLFAGIVSPIQCLLYRRVGEKRPAARAGLLAAALAALAAIGTLVALLLHVWLWAGLAAGLFLAAGLLGQAVRRHAEYTADLFASAVLGDQWPVKCLIARQALLLPTQAKLLRQTIATDAAQPSPDDETTSATPVDGDEAKQAISHFSRTRSAGGSADWLHELLTGEPAAALRISALSGLGGGRSTRHKLLGRLLVVLGGFIGYARARRELPVPEPVRVRPYVLLGVAGGLLMGAGGVFLVPEAPSVRLGIAGYFAFASAVCAMALVLGAANVFVFRTQKGSRAEFAWSVLVSVFCYVLAGMTAIVAFGGSTGASTGLIMLTMFFPACVCAGAAAAVWARLRPLPRSRAAPQTPQGAAEQAPDKADNPDKAE